MHCLIYWLLGGQAANDQSEDNWERKAIQPAAQLNIGL